MDPGVSFSEGEAELILRDEEREIGKRRLSGLGEHRIFPALKLEGILPWEHGNPKLYSLFIRLLDREGQEIELAALRIGFRRVEIRDGVMLLNGRRLVICGVNRHEWNARRGRSITREDMVFDMEVLKDNHINAVRTSHYPNQLPWYDLCDENGIYVMAETNLESHGSWQKMGDLEPSWNVPGDVPQWRALTDNDRGNRFYLRSGMWLSADMFVDCKEIRVEVDGREIPLPKAPENNRYTGKERARKVRVSFLYETITQPATRVLVTYEVRANGRIRMRVQYFEKKGLPELPVFGMRFVMPTKADGYEYEGLSGETYPDRMAGGIPGIYKIQGLPVTNYLVPQDCNVHMETKWLKVYRSTSLDPAREPAPSGLKFCGGEQSFAFSCIPYTPQELENATHQEELPPARRTVVSILGAVRGVGGIDSWGADVEPAYHISGEKDISYSFYIEKV